MLRPLLWMVIDGLWEERGWRVSVVKFGGEAVLWVLRGLQRGVLRVMRWVVWTGDEVVG